MPNIRSYEAPQLGLQPTEIGVESVAAAARRSGAFFNQAAQDISTLGHEVGGAIRDAGAAVDDHIAHQEISHGAATFAQLHADLTDKWNDTVKHADPNDTSVAGKFNETVLQPALEKFQGAFNTEKGQQWAEGHIDALREHMFQKGAADMSTLAGAALEQNIRQISHANTNTVLSDPSSGQFVMDNIDRTVDGLVDSSQVKGAEAAKARYALKQRMKEDVANAAAQGAIQQSNDPENAWQTVAKRWPNYIDAQAMEKYGKEAKTYKRANNYDADRAQRVQDQRMADASTDRRDSIIKDIYSDSPTVKMKDVLADPTLSAGDREHLVGILNREAKPAAEARVSHQTWIGLMARLHADDDTRLTSDKPIWDAMVAGKLTKADFNDALKEWRDSKTEDGEPLAKELGDFVKTYGPSIDPQMKVGEPTAIGAQKIYAMQQDIKRQVTALRAAGQDPHSLYDPSSPNFLGRPEKLAKYRYTLQEKVDYDARMKVDQGPAGDKELAIKRANTNLTGPDRTITGVERIDQPAGARTFVPPNNWQFSPSRQQYRDPSGVVYDVSGNRVK